MYLSQEEYFSLSLEDKAKYDEWLASLTENDEPMVYPVSLQDGIITDGNGDVAHLTEDNQIQFHV